MTGAPYYRAAVVSSVAHDDVGCDPIIARDVASHSCRSAPALPLACHRLEYPAAMTPAKRGHAGSAGAGAEARGVSRATTGPTRATRPRMVATPPCRLMLALPHTPRPPSLAPMADSLRDRLQTSLGPAYTLERELGGGGMARVFVARDRALGRDVVVKVLAPELAAGLSAQRFTREIRVAAALQEPHTVPVLTAGVTVDGLPYYTMPYVAGESLRARLIRGPVPLAEAIRVLRDVSQALAYAHRRGVVHRDIKPENVLLCEGTAVVTDFGIAKAVSAARTRDSPSSASASGVLTRRGTSLGTPAYMAPEQAAGDPDVDARADLYAWGVVAYELLGARHPFAGRTAAHQLVAAHIAEVPRPLHAAAPGLPAPLTALVMRCLAKDPAQRPASAAELLAMLDRVAGTLGTGAAGASARRVRVGGIAAGAAVVLAGVGVVWGTHQPPAAAGADSDARGPTRPVMLAVLPFENAGTPEQAVFADGLTDAVTAKLGALPGLAVIDRHSAAQYAHTAKPARQIGAELGVPYLLEGVVRWAQDAGGGWRAQVTPTLVDARAGTTTWTGEPVVITPTDPFTAQAQIATTVADALRLALRPADQAALGRRMTDDPEAFAAYVRGQAAFDAALRTADPQPDVHHAAAEFARAVALDSSFAEAWGELVGTELYGAVLAPGDRVAATHARATAARALAHVRGQPRALTAVASVRLVLEHDTVGADTLVRRALAAAPYDPVVLRRASYGGLVVGARLDTAYALARRAAALDPRSARTLRRVVDLAFRLRRWDDVRRYADAVIALDSTDANGWYTRLELASQRGDTLGLQRLLAQVATHVRRPDNLLLQYAPLAGDADARRYAALSAGELGIATLYDSAAGYYDNKADVFARLGDRARERVYYDSIRGLLTRRARDAASAPLLMERALAEAALGDRAAARGTLVAALAAARRDANRADVTDRFEPITVAALYARLGEPDTAVRWLAAGLSNPAGGWTARGYAAHPKLRILHGTPAFARLLREHPD